MSHVLDDAATYAIDASGMFGHIETLGPELQRGWHESRSIELPGQEFDRIVVAAMGGSAAAADYFDALASRKSPFAVETVRGYELPRHVDARSLVVLLSYSGETEEVLSCYEQAGERGAARLAVTTGGELARRAKSEATTWHRISYESPPRAALPHTLAALLRIGDMTGAITLCDADLTDAADTHTELVWRHIGQHIAAEANAAKQLAELLAESGPPVVFAPEHLASAGRRAKNQFAENAKVVAIFEEVPEATHNAIVGFERPGAAPLAAIAFDAPAIQSANRRRLDFLTGLIEETGGAMARLQMRGVSRLADLLEATAWSDYLSCYLALLRGADPTPTPSLVRMRTAMAGTPEPSANLERGEPAPA